MNYIFPYSFVINRLAGFHLVPIFATVIVAQSRKSNHSIFKTKCYTIENNGKKHSEKNSKTNKGGFLLP